MARTTEYAPRLRDQAFLHALRRKIRIALHPIHADNRQHHMVPHACIALGLKRLRVASRKKAATVRGHGPAGWSR
jgi:hypothetical protein